MYGKPNVILMASNSKSVLKGAEPDRETSLQLRHIFFDYFL